MNRYKKKLFCEWLRMEGPSFLNSELGWMDMYAHTYTHTHTRARIYTHDLSLARRHQCHSRAARLPDAQRVDNSTSCRILSRQENCQRPLRRFYDRIMPITWLLSRATWSPSPTVLWRHVLFSRKLSCWLILPWSAPYVSNPHHGNFWALHILVLLVAIKTCWHCPEPSYEDGGDRRDPACVFCDHCCKKTPCRACWKSLPSANDVFRARKCSWNGHSSIIHTVFVPRGSQSWLAGTRAGGGGGGGGSRGRELLKGAGDARKTRGSHLAAEKIADLKKGERCCFQRKLHFSQKSSQTLCASVLVLWMGYMPVRVRVCVCAWLLAKKVVIE